MGGLIGNIGKFLGRVGGAVLKIPGTILAKTVGALLPAEAKRLIARWGPLASTVILIATGAGLVDLPALNLLIQILGAPLEHPDQLAQVGVTLAAVISAAFGVGSKAENTVAEIEGKRDRIAKLSQSTELALESANPGMLWIHRRARFLVERGSRPHDQAVLQAMRELRHMSAGDLSGLPILRAGE